MQIPLSLDLQQLLALGIFASYFMLIGWLASVVYRSIQHAISLNREEDKSIWRFAAFCVLALASFGSTWFYMFKFMFWSFVDYESHHTTLSKTLLERIANWLVNTALFEQAWARVSFGAMNWWWSEQLCLFTVGAWTMFLYAQGSRYNIKNIWAYTLLGQLVAISVAANLFWLAIVCSPKPRSRESSTTFPPLLWACVLLAMGTVALSPFTDKQTFLPNLLVMHVLITIPLFSSPSTTPKSESFALSPSVLYSLIFFFSIPIRSRTVLALQSNWQEGSIVELFEAAWDVLYSHPAQSSIGWDVICTSVSFAVWTALSCPSESKTRSRWFTIPYVVLATPFASVGVTASYVLRPQVEGVEEKERPKEE